MSKEDDPEAFINAFERMAVAAGWLEAQWSAILIPFLIGPAQLAMDTLPLQDLCDYKKVRAAVLQRLNLNPEAYLQWLWEIEFGLHYHSHRMGQRIWAARVRWLQSEEHTKD